MKWLILVVMGFCTFSGYAQTLPASYHFGEKTKTTNNTLSPDSLAVLLTKNYTSEKDKVTSLFRWITDNIAYGVSKQPSVKHHSNKYNLTEEKFDSIIDSKSLNERVAYSVLAKKMAACNGYSRLFKTLCDYSGIKCEIITGYANSNAGSSGKKFRSNHTWNAVMIDSNWHLLDVTWASGYILYGSNEFVRQYDGYYFLTPPESLIYSHFPEDPRWTLLDKEPTVKEFNKSPFKPSAFIKYQITSFTPATGIINASIGDTLLFELNSKDIEKDLKVSPDHDYDSLFVTGYKSHQFLMPSLLKENAIYYQYVVTDESVKWLNIVYNNDMVLRYNLNVKQQKQ